jgi:hypothetical protein
MPTRTRIFGCDISLPRAPARALGLLGGTPLIVDWALLGGWRIIVIPLSEHGLSQSPEKASAAPRSISGLRYVESLPDVA